ncbi:putative GH43/DUF377 family glycosyl hydrolase [Chitinophaga niastensis]|uniref:Putative GH43/DUF377 family glycosyl hydrolase n=1 Tax=Chitinophaga niastensis TaxID=536980 RepID=A0A2P8HB78_CHINA|nr:pesticidal protein Cry7Aa [Chitinophaga niastensis]PSL43485.1 putative GH43/DUF377 family glycosyl hydrolase [Chitinophaga niastensis]
MIAIKKEGILLEKTNFTFENEGVLNPAVIRVGEEVHIFYRAVRQGNHSTIGYCKLKDPLTVSERADTPLLFPQFDYESKGLEDPRIVKIDDLYYLTYTAYDGTTASGALATSSDLVHFEKKGLIVSQIKYNDFINLAECREELNEKYERYNSLNTILWSKDLVFFPRKINNKFHFLHRVKPDIQIVAVNDLAELTTEFWQNYFLHFDDYIVLAPKYDHEVSYVGGGCPPIETKSGWLLIYHGVHDTVNGYVYVGCAALLDLENPLKEIARLPYALITPESEWELKGDVSNVCFPTGTAVFGDTLYIYYGAGDDVIASASVSLSALLTELLSHKTA